MTPTPGGVTVIIPTWNRADLLAEVLRNVAAQTHRPAEVIVVDNGSADESVAVAERAGASVIALPRNRGFAFAVNRGIERSQTEWVLVLNNDVRLRPDWLARVLAGVTAENTWFACGKLLVQNEPTTIDGTFDAVSRGGTAWRCGNGRADGPIWNESRTIQFIPLTAAVIRRHLFEEVGFLDETFESYLEDVDFGLRCAASRRSGIYVPDAVGMHQGSATLGAWHKATVRRISRNQILLIRKHFGGAPGWPILVAHVLWGLTAVRRGAGWAWVAGKLEGFKSEVRQTGSDWLAVRDAVCESEADIRRLQGETGFDSYWKAYFFLTRKS